MNWMDGFQETMEHLSHAGAFLSVAGDAPNTMTIGWAWIGWCWKQRWICFYACLIHILQRHLQK